MHNKLFLYLPVLAAGLLLFSAGETRAELNATISVDSHGFEPGEEIEVTVRITNTGSDQTLEFPTPSSWQNAIRVRLPDRDQVLRQPAEENTGEQTQTLAPGEFFGKTFSIAPGENMERATRLHLRWMRNDLVSNNVEVFALPEMIGKIGFAEFDPIFFSFHSDAAPRNVFHFRRLLREGDYEGLTFHRLIPGYLMQGGDPQGDGTGGRTPNVEPELTDIPHENGTISMARGPNNPQSGMQFFITLGRHKHLDGQYSTVAQVLEEHLSVLDTIQNQVETDHQPGERCGIDHLDQPQSSITMQNIELMTPAEYEQWEPPQEPESGSENGSDASQEDTGDNSGQERERPEPEEE